MKPVPEALSARSVLDESFRVRWRVATTNFTCDAFLTTLSSLVLFPERTSSIILRAEILDESQDSGVPQAFSSLFSSWKLDKLIKRRLLPRNPRIDQDMLQNCFFFSPVHVTDRTEREESLIIYEPLDKLHIPFYHPQVSAIAFHYTSEHFEISIIPLPEHIKVDDRLDLPNRVDRTLLFLMSTIVKHSVGHMNNYEKRVQHDLVVQKSAWQDLYIKLKGLYATDYLAQWVECTDPKKHVFEDLGIASFLINLWQQASQVDIETIRFVDIGCGNGLLVDILHRQGWTGYGFDARHRKSWSVYGTATQSLLQERILYPTILDQHSTETFGKTYFVSTGAEPLPENSALLHFGLFDTKEFLIGNHADELTPFIPLLAALSSASKDVLEVCATPKWTDTMGFMIIPCCTHTFSGAKHNGLSTVGGRYASYITWLVNICERVGWEVEKEALRIPSTRNWAIIGRRRRLVEDELSGSEISLSDSLGSCERGINTPFERLQLICQQIIEENGGMQGFLEHAKALTSSKPRGH